jgi:hypothetical protein
MCIRIFILCLSISIAVRVHAQNAWDLNRDTDLRSHEKIPCDDLFSMGKELSNSPWNFSVDRNTRSGSMNELPYFVSLDYLYEFNSPQDSIPGRKREQRFDDNNNLILLKEYLWDSLAWGWIPKRKQVHSYDATGQERLIVSFEWDGGSNKWINYAKDSLVFDDPDTQMDYYLEWDENKKAWIFLRKIIEQFNDSQQLTDYSLFYYDSISIEWYGCCKNEFQFDEQGNMILELQYSWDNDLQDFSLWGKGELEYDETGELKEYIRYQLDEVSKEWINWEKRTYSNFTDQIRTMEYYSWDINLQQWILKITYRNYFDEKGNYIGMESFDFDPDQETPVSGFKFHYTLNEEDLLMLETDYLWDPDIEDWYVTSKYFYHYENPVITHLQEAQDEKIVIFPNPSDSYLFISGSIEGASIQLFSLQGNLILDKRFRNEVFDVSGLSPGIYLLQLSRPKEKPLKMPFIKR